MTTTKFLVRAAAVLAPLAMGLGAINGPLAAAEPDFAAIDRYVEAEREAQSIPGIALAVVQGDRIVHQRGFGAADGTGRHVTPQTPFLIGSLTKSFTALAVLQLVEAGQLELDAPVQSYLPWFRVAEPEASARITLRHLLHQTSGLSTSVGNAWITKSDVDDSALERRVRDLHSAQLAHPVGAAYEYSNANYAVLGLVVQSVSGKSYEEYVQDEIFAPLGMVRSFTSEEAAEREGMASGHRYWFGVPQPADLPRSRGDKPAGFLVASVEDMARYLVANLNDGQIDGRTVLSAAGMAELHRPAVEAGGPDASYAMGWSVSRDGNLTVVGHTGETLDFRATMALIPEHDLAYVLLMNADTAFGRTRMAAIGEGVYGHLLGREVVPTRSDLPQRALLYGMLAAIVLIQLASTGRSIGTLRRWMSVPERRPRGRSAAARAIALPLILNAGWSVLVLVLLPRALGASVALMVMQMPDVGSVLVASGTLAALWATIRTSLALLLARRAMHSGEGQHSLELPARPV